MSWRLETIRSKIEGVAFMIESMSSRIDGSGTLSTEGLGLGWAVGSMSESGTEELG